MLPKGLATRTREDYELSVFSSVSPSDPTDVVGVFEDTSREQVTKVISDSADAQRQWWAMGAVARADALHGAALALASRAKEITELAVREVGKPISEMEGETARAVSILRYYSQAALDPDGTSLPSSIKGGLLLSRRRPHGVVGTITPWNFPAAIPMWKAAPALAYGNVVVCKPAPAATAVALLLEEIMASHLPPGCFKVVTGNQVVGEALVAMADAISFTGSSAVGRSVVQASAARGIPVQAEMGGQNPSIVLRDANIEASAAVIARAAMGFSGQKCTATSRVIVVGDPRRFTEALSEAIAALSKGDPFSQETVVGPVISQAAMDAVADGAMEAKRGGGRVVSGGDRFERRGFCASPTLVDGVDPSARIAQEEIFGPFALVLPAKDDEEALQIANSVRYGLVASIFTNDLDRALDLSSKVETGLVRINAPTSGVDFFAPFGGVKESSYGPREQGKAAQEFYTWTQTLTISPRP